MRVRAFRVLIHEALVAHPTFLVILDPLFRHFEEDEVLKRQLVEYVVMSLVLLLTFAIDV